ncbi:MAG TPA: hypothetical protein VJG32_17930 [Anaerolineae bacterium]|nr:hypothetical protein [Anaerolineae bacterium]
MAMVSREIGEVSPNTATGPALEMPAVVLEFVRLLEAVTYRNQANNAIKVAIAYVVDAASTLARSKFGETAIDTFRGRVSNALANTARELAGLGWYAGGGSGNYPGEVVSEYLAAQRNYLDRWIADIRQLRALPGGPYRAQMYAQSAEQVYQRAYMRARGEKAQLPDLPAYPKDGSTRCRANCHCRWEIKRVSDTEYHAIWKLQPGENCEDCLRRAKEWNPLRIVNIDGVWAFATALEPFGGFGL